MPKDFEARLASVVTRTLLGRLVAVGPMTLSGCNAPVTDEPVVDLCDSEDADVFTTYLLVDDGEICPGFEDVPADQVLQLGCACPVMAATQLCGDEDRVNDPYDASGSPFVGQDACGYLAVGVGLYCCGRPLLRDGVPVLAPVGGTSDWSVDHAAPDTSALTEGARAMLTATWSEVARMEHASIASFARFTLALLTHGAPAELLADAQQAGLDEVRHAQDAFALASAYAGHPVVPGPMDLSGTSITGDSLADLAVACVLEGCIGETIAAVEAAHRLVGTTDAAVARALTRVVDEEGRHAAMAWRALAWLLDVGGEPAWIAVQQAFDAPRTAASGPEHVGAGVHHGLLGRAALRVAHQQAWNDVIRPAWHARRAERMES